MKRWLRLALTTIAILGLFACAQPQRQITEAAPEPPTPVSEEGYGDWLLVVEGLPLDDPFEDREKARAVLIEVLGEDFTDEELRELYARTQQEDVRAADLPQALTGVAGFSVTRFLAAYLGQEEQVSGKVRKYYFNDEEKGGYLEVDTLVETLSGGTVVDEDRYFWAIAVRPPTYEVRDHSGDPDNPFPDTVVISDPAMLQSIADRRLDQKLWAEGEGIIVVAVEKNGVVLPTDHPLYASTAASCIDMMFWGIRRGANCPGNSPIASGAARIPRL